MDPPNTGVVFCAIIFDMLICKHFNYYKKYDTDRLVPFDTAFFWVVANKDFYKFKMKELALAPIGDTLKRFSYEYDFTFDDVKDLDESARLFLSEVYDIDPLFVSNFKIKHFMQIACEYLFTEIDYYQALIEIIFIKFRMNRRNGQDTLEEKEEDKARLLYLDNNNFLGGTECPICFEDRVLYPCCSRNHTICRTCWLHPRVKKCPFCREVRPLF